MPDPTIFISAGEASGEAYGALLIATLKKKFQSLGRQAKFVGMGGPGMAAAGLDRIVRAEDVAVMGITEVVLHLPRIYREFRKLKRAIRERRPSVAILIDFPDIHFALAKEFHRLGIPVLFFVSPQLWAWKKHRIKLVQQYVDRMLVIFPFEEPFYRQRGVNAEFVGHPLVDLPLPSLSREQFAAAKQLDPGKTWIALLPGSRAKEIRANLPEMLAAARSLSTLSYGEKGTREQETKGVEFILPLAQTLSLGDRLMVRQLIEQHAPGLPIHTTDSARAALFHARSSVVASGTATVEAALIGNPFVVVYRVSALTYAIAKRVVDVPHVAMVNLIAGKRIVPELIQNDFTAANIVQHLAPLLPDGPPRQSMMEELQRVRALLSVRQGRQGESPGAIERVADLALEVLGIASPAVESVQS